MVIPVAASDVLTENTIDKDRADAISGDYSIIQMIWLPVALVFAVGVGLAFVLPSASPVRRLLVLRFGSAIIIFLHVALGVYAIGFPSIFLSVAFAPLAEELVRLYVLRGRNSGPAPNWRAAVYTGLLFALFEMNRLVRMIKGLSQMFSFVSRV